MNGQRKKERIHSLDVIVYSLIVMKIQYTEQQYNDLENVWFVHNSFSASLKKDKKELEICAFFFSRYQQHAEAHLGPLSSRTLPSTGGVCFMKWVSKAIQNLQNDFMCTHIPNVYPAVVESLFKNRLIVTRTSTSVLGFWILIPVLTKQQWKDHHLMN